MPLDMERGEQALKRVLASRQLAHLRIARRRQALTIVSGPETAPEPEARLTLIAPGVWRLDLPLFNGKWEQTPFEGGMVELVDNAISIGRFDDPRSLQGGNQEDTSEPSH